MEPLVRRITPFNGMSLSRPLDAVIWVAVLAFFILSALISDGDMTMSVLGALGIVVIMFLVGAAVEVIIETLRHLRGLGTMVGFITNGPETLCLIVGLIAGDVLYAASTPLGSNVINPVMLVAAAALTSTTARTIRTNPGYTAVCILATAFMAVNFFFIPQGWYFFWLIAAAGATAVLFLKRPAEVHVEAVQANAMSKVWFLPAFVILLTAGYLLDPLVSFTARHSHTPKGVIGFFVLATLTSWPEFKSTLSLLGRGLTLAAILNITVSNITNIWLAMLGVIYFLIAR